MNEPTSSNGTQTKLPRILILDDHAYWSPEERDELCRVLALKDVTPDGVYQSNIAREPFLAEAVFHAAQRLEDSDVEHSGRLTNDVDLAMKVVAGGWDDSPEPRWALVLLDLQFTEGAFRGRRPDPRNSELWPQESNDSFGLRLLEEMANRWPDDPQTTKTAIPVVTLSKQPQIEVEKHLNALGNLGYLDRSLEKADRRIGFADALFKHALVEDGALHRVEPTGTKHTPFVVPISHDRPLIGRSLPFLRTLRTARNVARTSTPCLILGERGTGKELIARYIHELSSRREKRLVAVNCGAIPEGLIESELFGHVEGSFTNATKDRKGKFEEADGGILFLDEIGNMSLSAQAKVLRVLQEREITPIGSNAVVEVDVRVIAATNQDLIEEAHRNNFRLDLLDRLYAWHIMLPPLRLRPDDIKHLFDHALSEELSKIDGAVPFEKKKIDEGVYASLRDPSRQWMGNVRELEQRVAAYVAATRSDAVWIIAADLPPQDSFPEPFSPLAPPPATEDLSLENLRVRLRKLQFTPEEAERRGILRELEAASELIDDLKRRVYGAAASRAAKPGGKVNEAALVRRLWDDNSLQETQVSDKLLGLLSDDMKDGKKMSTQERRKLRKGGAITKRLIEHWNTSRIPVESDPSEGVKKPVARIGASDTPTFRSLEL